MMVGDALAAYYIAHQLPADGGAADPVFHVRIGPFTVPAPNPPGRRRAVVFHDVNHLVTGYNTTFSDGEVVIAGFEVGAGCGSYWIVWYINLSMMALGILFRPRDVFAAFVRGRRSASIYRHGADPAALARMSVADVRMLLALDRRPEPAAGADRVAFAAWGVAAAVVLVGPLLALVAGGLAVLRLALR
jgi:hypothetical protein